MNVYRKSLMVQLLLFIVFFIMGGYTILEFYFRATYPWIGYILLGFLVLVGVLGFYLYKRQDQSICIITEKEMMTMRYLLYGYFLVYVLEMILPSIIKSINQEVLAIASGALLMVIAVIGTVLQVKILKIK